MDGFGRTRTEIERRASFRVTYPCTIFSLLLFFTTVKNTRTFYYTRPPDPSRSLYTILVLFLFHLPLPPPPPCRRFVPRRLGPAYNLPVPSAEHVPDSRIFVVYAVVKHARRRRCTLVYTYNNVLYNRASAAKGLSRVFFLFILLLFFPFLFIFFLQSHSIPICHRPGPAALSHRSAADCAPYSPARARIARIPSHQSRISCHSAAASDPPTAIISVACSIFILFFFSPRGFFVFGSPLHTHSRPLVPSSRGLARL